MAGQQDRTRCYGRLLEMSRGRGWILPLQEIAHPAAGWNRGHIYLTKEDVLPGFALRPGDLVAFYLYADKKGLGAEECFLVGGRDAKVPQVAAAWPPKAKQAGQPPQKQKRAAWPVPKSKPGTRSGPAAWWNQKDIQQPTTPSPPQRGGCMPSPPLEAARLIEAPPGLERSLVQACIPSPPGFDPPAADSGDEGDSDSALSACDGSVTAKSTKSSACEGSTCAGRTESVAGSDKWTTSSKSPVSAATKALEKALAAGGAADVFSDDGDEEPAAEPMPSAVKAVAQNRVLPVGYKVYQI